MGADGGRSGMGFINEGKMVSGLIITVMLYGLIKTSNDFGWFLLLVFHKKKLDS